MVSSNNRPLKYYAFSESKIEVNNVIQLFFSKYSQNKPPNKYQRLMIHNYPDLSTDASRSWNSDTIQFNFYVKQKGGEDIVFWTKFVGGTKEWNTSHCELSLKGYYLKDEWKTISDFGFFRPIWADKKIKLFEKEILLKLQIELEKLSRTD